MLPIGPSATTSPRDCSQPDACAVVGLSASISQTLIDFLSPSRLSRAVGMPRTCRRPDRGAGARNRSGNLGTSLAVLADAAEERRRALLVRSLLRTADRLQRLDPDAAAQAAAWAAEVGEAA